MDGEAAENIFFLLPSPAPTLSNLLLPNSNLFNCCADFKTTVLADGIGTDEFKNDITSFLDICSPTASAAVYKLYKDNSIVATLNGSTYGTYKAFGFRQLGQQKYIGFIIDWWKVLDALGSGIYKVGLSVTDAMLGNTTTYSNEFKLCEYRADRAEQTIRIDWYQNGTIGNTNDQKLTKNYLDLNWRNQIRLPGFFGYPETEGIKEFVRYWTGQEVYTKDEQSPIYKLKTKRIPAFIQTLLRIEIMTSDRCLITDYNSKNAEVFQNFEIAFEPAHKPNWKPLQSKLADVEILCRQRYNNLKKHRYN